MTRPEQHRLTVQGFLETLVMVAITVPLVVAFFFFLGRDTIPGAAETASLGGHSLLSLTVAAACLVAAAWIPLCYLLGPLAATRARMIWQLSLGDPAGQLRAMRIRAFAIGFVAAAVPAGVAALSVATWGLPWAWGAAGASLLLVGGLAFAMEVQRRDRPEVVRVAGVVATTVAVGLTVSEIWGVVPALLLLSVLAVLVRVGRPAMPSMSGHRPAPPLTPAWQLSRAAMNRWLVGVGVTALDPTAVMGTQGSVQRASAARLPKVLFRVPAPWGLAVVFFVRVLTLRAVAYMAAAVLAVTTGRIWGDEVGIAILLIVQFAIVLDFSKSLVEWQMNHTFRRVWPFSRALVVALAAPAVVASLLISLPAALLLDASGLGLAVMALLPAAVLWRRLQALRADDSQLLMVSTPAGAVPVQVVNRLLAGPDVVVLAIIVLSLTS